MVDYSKQWRELADVKDELAARDWFPGTSGNLSIKVSDSPLQFLVTASGGDKRKRTANDFLVVNQEGHKIEDTELRPSAETPLHRELYKTTDARCILHVHTVENNVISELYGDEGVVLFKDQELIKAFGLWEEDAEIRVPIVENYSDLDELANAVASNVGVNIFGVLIRNHGITAWGRSAFEAKRHLEAFEFLFRYHLQIRSLQKQLI